MKYNLCSSCMNFQPRLLTEEYSVPKSCRCPALEDLFGISQGGFPSGIDIIHCDFHLMFPAVYGDVLVSDDNDNKVSWVLTQPRNFKLIRVPTLYDNSQNIKLIKLNSNQNGEKKSKR